MTDGMISPAQSHLSLSLTSVVAAIPEPEATEQGLDAFTAPEAVSRHLPAWADLYARDCWVRAWSASWS